MTKFWSTYQILMIFLLLLFVMPFSQTMAQDNTSEAKNQSQLLEERLMMNLNENQQNPFENRDNNSIRVPNRFKRTASQQLGEGQNMAFDEQGNYVHLDIDGNDNAVEAIQNGSQNRIDVGIYANQVEAFYMQQGNRNVIQDEIRANGKAVNITQGASAQMNGMREIYQYGNNLGILNQGMQTTPMIINQRGTGMKIKITESPMYQK